MAGTIGREMAASYSVEIGGIKRTRAELSRLDAAIHSLRTTQYSPGMSTTVASNIGSKDLFVSKMDALEGRVQTTAVKAMDAAMKRGKEYQTFTLAAAVTATGLSGRGRAGEGRRGPGRDDTGAMIDAIDTNVETYKATSETFVTGWHGWSTSGRRYFPFQEKGTELVPAANSLGAAIPPTREFLKQQLGALKR